MFSLGMQAIDMYDISYTATPLAVSAAVHVVLTAPLFMRVYFSINSVANLSISDRVYLLNENLQIHIFPNSCF